MNGDQGCQKKNITPVSFQPPTGGPGSSWYDWAIKFYNRSYSLAEELTPDLIEKLKEHYRWTQLDEVAKQGARYEPETACFMLPIRADLWKGVKDGNKTR